MRNASEQGLSPSQADDLRHLAGIMIPPNDAYGVPGADDPAIFADLLGSLGRDERQIRNALAKLAALAQGDFAGLDRDRQEAVAESLLSGDSPDIAALGRVVLQCYYRDDRVVRSLGLEPRSPFPKGHILEQGDWTLLDVVRSRPKMWRDAP